MLCMVAFPQKVALRVKVALTLVPVCTSTCSSYLYTMSHFYECKARCSRWVAEMRWLCEDWDKLDVPDVPELFSQETDVHFSKLDASRKFSDCQRLSEIAADCL